MNRARIHHGEVLRPLVPDAFLIPLCGHPGHHDSRVCNVLSGEESSEVAQASVSP
jgi:hypothetical protein